MSFKSLREADLYQKSVLVRVDFNVPVDEKGEISEDFKIRKTLPLIQYLKEKKIKRLILISHFGQPKSSRQKKKFSLKPIAGILGKILKEKIYFFPEPIGDKLEKKIKKLEKGEICLLENIRYYKGEEKNDSGFAKKISQLGDLYINEAFSVSHRKSASLVALTRYLPSYPGFLFEEEIKNLNRLLKNPKAPLVVILGGAKVKDKLPLLKKFLLISDYVLVGGVIANTILKAWDFEIGKSVYEKESVSLAKKIGSQKAELILPGDFKVLKGKIVKTKELGNLGRQDIIFDIGENTINYYEKIILKAKTIFWNGPMGKIENKNFSQGTERIIKAILKNKKAFTVIGGGETLVSFKGRFLESSHLFFSTGGGAALSYLAGKSLPGISALNK
ncbi:MAG: phosphoglycerate kinase [Candidatus Pacebacteria bacterium]|nr:phosphoglycerate kinase [Candidatus Paceibacterota bacterium]MDD3548513.1 phosphoglycerate kinase [Candidatus Paceibacterota bacterium]MDD4999154.1 phosphoglycerate kinase [Candidatus Paceibacterota bacterium]MDD5545268.1 phosphoglycerate kinase [Candidatus Paceibacterota bacterium]